MNLIVFPVQVAKFPFIPTGRTYNRFFMLYHRSVQCISRRRVRSRPQYPGNYAAQLNIYNYRANLSRVKSKKPFRASLRRFLG